MISYFLFTSSIIHLARLFNLVHGPKLEPEDTII